MHQQPKLSKSQAVLLSILLCAAATQAQAAGPDNIKAILVAVYDALFKDWGPYIAALLLGLACIAAHQGRGGVEWKDVGSAAAIVAAFFSIPWLLSLVGVSVA